MLEHDDVEKGQEQEGKLSVILMLGFLSQPIYLRSIAHHQVNVLYEDGTTVDAKGIGRKIIDKVKETYDTELGGKDFAYDGEKSLFTVGSLPTNKHEFTVVPEDVSSRNNENPNPDQENQNDADRKRVRRPYQSKSFRVELSFTAKIPMQTLANVIKGQENENT